MGLLQIQMRDLMGFRDTRLQILTLRPNHKIHWLSYALALHVCNDPNAAVGVIDSYMDTLGGGDVDSPTPPHSSKNSIAALQCKYENSELALYKNTILSETTATTMTATDENNITYTIPTDELYGVRKALAHLDTIQSIVVDMTGWYMLRLSYELQLGMFMNAKDTAIQLFKRGLTEDHRVHGAYMCALLQCDVNTCREVWDGSSRGSMSTLATLRPLLDCERTILLNAYFGSSTSSAAVTTTANNSNDKNNGETGSHGGGDSNNDSGVGPGGLASAFPTSSSIKRIRLTILSPTSEEFKISIDKYCQHQIIKGVPSLGSDLSSLYLMEVKHEQKQQSCNDQHHEPSANNGDSSSSTNGELLPTVTRYVLAKDPVDVKLHVVYRILVDLVDSYILSLSSNCTFPPKNDSTTATTTPSVVVTPSTLLWAWYLRAILHEQAGEYSQGISLINKCIDHTPTAVDFYELKARLLESGGELYMRVFTTTMQHTLHCMILSFVFFCLSVFNNK
jgi:peptide alpha-N-acetyltransferase